MFINSKRKYFSDDVVKVFTTAPKHGGDHALYSIYNTAFYL